VDIKKYISDNLNQEQTAAALHVETSSLILAGAGSGKTRTLTYKIAYLVYGLGVYPDEIFGVTFTNKAANEMKHRLNEIAKDLDSLIQAENPDSPPTPKPQFHWIGTFHSLFLRFLKQEINHYGNKYNTNF